MAIIGFHAYLKDGKGYLANSRGETREETPYLDWLLSQGQNNRLVCYDLDYFASVLFRLIELTEDEAKILNENHKLNLTRYQLTYFPGRWLSIDMGHGYGHPWAGFYNMSQHFAGPAPLDLEPNREHVIEKAKKASLTAFTLLTTYKQLGLADKLVSPVAALKASLLKNFELVTCQDIEGNLGDTVNDFALKCTGGSWREVFSMGYYPKVYDYDISGAYASQLAELYDFRRGTWIRDRVRPQGAIYGFARVQVDINARLSPIVYIMNNSTFTPVGSWETYLTLNELDFILNHRIGHFEILDAVWCLPVGKRGINGKIYSDAMYQPMKGIIQYLWDKRGKASELGASEIKRGMAGLWGMELESHEENGEVVYGEGFNPVWGAVVEKSVNLIVAKKAIEHQTIPLSVAIDGLVSDTAFPEISGDRELGGWRLSHEGQAIIGGNNMVAIETKEGAGELSLRFDWLEKAIKDNPEADSYTMHGVSHVSLAEAVKNDKLKDLGETVVRDYTLKVKSDNKRFYADVPRTGGELISRRYDSSPLTIGDLLARGGIR